MDKYIEAIPLSFDIDKASEEEAERKIDKFVSSFKASLGDLGFDNIAEEIANSTKTNLMLQELDDMLAELDGLQGEQIDNLREQLQLYRNQLDPNKDLAELLDEQFRLHQEIAALEKEGNAEELESLTEMSRQLSSQINLLGTDGQLGILEQKRDLEKQILALSVLNTDEARDQLELLQERLDYLNDVYDIESDDDKNASGMELAKGATDMLSEYGDVFGQEFTKGTKQFGNILSGFQTGFAGGIAAVGVAFIASLSDTLKEGAESAKELLGANRYSDSGTRQTMLDWGTTKAGAYGVNQAMQIMGFSSQEDVWNSSSKELKKFHEIQNRFAQRFTAMQESGLFEQMLESQIEMNELELELQEKEAEFYMENQDSIMAIKEFTLDIKLILTQMFGWIVKFFGGPKYTNDDTQKTVDILEAATVKNDNSRQINVTVDRSFNNQSASDKSSVETALSNFFNVVDANLS